MALKFKDGENVSPVVAIDLIHALLSWEVEVTKEVNSRKGGVTKSTLKAEREAVANLFMALVKREPTQAEIDQITEL